MLASKHRSRGAAALREGEAATALEALKEAQQLTPEDQSLWPLIQRAEMMLGREGESSEQVSADGDGAQIVASANATVNATDNAAVNAANATTNGTTVGVPAAASEGAADEGTSSGLPEGWAEGSLDGTPFYYPVADPSRILWAPPLPQMAVPPAAPPDAP